MLFTVGGDEGVLFRRNGVRFGERGKGSLKSRGVVCAQRECPFEPWLVGRLHIPVPVVFRERAVVVYALDGFEDIRLPVVVRADEHGGARVNQQGLFFFDRTEAADGYVLKFHGMLSSRATRAVVGVDAPAKYTLHWIF